MGKPNYEKPTSQVDLEQRLKKDDVPNGTLVHGTTPEPSDNGYVNVDPIYQNYANPTEQPLRAESGVQKKIEEGLYADDVDLEKGATPEGEADADEEGEGDETPQGSSSSQTTTTQGAAATPPSPTPPTPPSNS